MDIIASVNSLCEVRIIDVAVLCVLSISFLATRRDPPKFPASTAVAVLAFPSSYLKVPIKATKALDEKNRSALRTCVGVASFLLFLKFTYTGQRN